MAEFFVNDALRIVAVLEVLQEKNGVYNEEDLLMYTTSVHAMKSALMNVGESGLSAYAGRLEQAGRNKETSLMAAETPAFLGGLRTVIEKLTPQKDAGTGGKTIDGDNSYLVEELADIKKACGIYDRKTAKDKIIELRQKNWPSPISELLRSMSEYLLSGDFNEVSRVADKIIEAMPNNSQ